MVKFDIIPISEVPKYVQSAFDGDQHLKEYCNPVFFSFNAEISEKEIVHEICNQIIEYKNKLDSSLSIIGIQSMNKQNQLIPVGFFVYSNKLKNLYSFGVNKEYRVPYLLAGLFDTIRIALKNFNCIMNKRNQRAIHWLERCGMKILDGAEPSSDTVYLVYDKN